MTTPIPMTHHRGGLLLLAAFPGLAGILALSLSLPGSEAPNHTPPPSKLASAAGSRFPLEISPDPTLLGTLTVGQHARATVTLRNKTLHAVEILRVETSCDCLDAEPVSFSIGPSESVDVRLTFDPSHAPDFRGGLSINVIGYGLAGAIIFRTFVNLDVRAESAGATTRELTNLARFEKGGPNAR